MGLGPLIGLLALGGLEAGREPILNRRSAILGRNRQRQAQRGSGVEELPQGGLLGDIGIGDTPGGAGDPLRRGGAADTKFNESGAIFYGGGDISAANFLSQRYEQDLQTQGEAAAQRRAGTAAAAGLQNAALNREKFEFQKAQIENSAQQATAYADWTIDTYGTAAEKELTGNQFTPPSVRASVSDGILGRTLGSPGNPVLGADAAVRGAEWLDVPQGDRAEIIGLENQLGVTEQTLEFMEARGLAGRLASPEETAQVMSTYSMNSMNFLRQYFEAGAMQEADLELFETLAGDPNAWAQFTDRERGRVKSIMEAQSTRLNTLNRSHGLSPGPQTAAPVDPATGGPLTQVDTADLVNEARTRASERVQTAPWMAGTAAPKPRSILGPAPAPMGWMASTGRGN